MQESNSNKIIQMNNKFNKINFDYDQLIDQSNPRSFNFNTPNINQRKLLTSDYRQKSGLSNSINIEARKTYNNTPLRQTQDNL